MEKELNEDERTFIGKTIRIFLSHTEKYKKLAGEIKSSFKDFGIEVFLAHDDLTPSKDWRDELVRNIKTCDIFIPLLTEDYSDSQWTDQECGMAYYDNKIIIPLKIDVDPYGFIGKYQALKFNSKLISESCEEILDIIWEHKSLEEQLKDCLIRAFIRSITFRGAERRAERLDKYKSFTEEQIEEIIRGSIKNTQINDSYGCKPILRKWLKKFNKSISEENKKKLTELLE